MGDEKSGEKDQTDCVAYVDEMETGGSLGGGGEDNDGETKEWGRIGDHGHHEGRP